MDCLNLAMSTDQSRPEIVKSHRRAAVMSVVYGICGWLLVIAGGLPFLLSRGGISGRWMGLAGILVLAGLIPALMGLSNAASALRTRGDRIVPATCGLVLTGSQIGMMLGLLIINIWHS